FNFVTLGLPLSLKLSAVSSKLATSKHSGVKTSGRRRQLPAIRCLTPDSEAATRRRLCITPSLAPQFARPWLGRHLGPPRKRYR
ncbi:hypothetical protein U1Q18_005030, partial [Sarracenia purpurea var. burkii]